MTPAAARPAATAWHVMHVIDSLARGGAERMLVDIANATVDGPSGASVSVCISRRADDLASELRPGITRHVLGRRRRVDPIDLRRFAALVRAGRVDLLHVHSRSTLSFVALARLLRLVDVPVVFHDHFGAIGRDQSVPPWLRWWGRRYVDSYVGVCDELASWAERALIPRGKVHVIENALDLRRLSAAEPAPLRRMLGCPPEAAVGIAVAGIREDKGLDVLLDAAAGVRVGRPFVIAVAGKEQDAGYARRCYDSRAALGLTGRVLFLGERADVPSLIRGADFGVVPSRSESGPLALIEYLAGALPVVATTTGGVARRAAECGVPGLVPAGAPAALAGALRELLESPRDQWQARGALGARVAQEHFDIRRVMPRWYDVYRRAVPGLPS